MATEASHNLYKTQKHDIKVHLYIIYIATENLSLLLCRFESSVHIDRQAHTHAHVLPGNLLLVDMITSEWSFCDSLQTLGTNSNWITNESKKMKKIQRKRS